MAVNKWPADNPKHIQIPPPNASPAQMELLRFVKHLPPIADDYLASFKDPEQKNLAARNKDNPEYYATSFFTNIEKMYQLIELNPEKWRNKKIILAFLEKEHGFCYINSKGHASVWFYEGEFPKRYSTK